MVHRRSVPYYFPTFSDLRYILKTAPARGHMNYLQIPSTPVTGDWLWGPPSRRDTSYLALALLHGPLRSIPAQLYS